MSAAERLSFSDVLVTPYTDLLDASYGTYDHRGGPHWPDWDLQTGARHQREGRPIDELPIPDRATERLAGPIAWGGPIALHFGHQIADFSMRLVSTLAADPETTIAFASHPRWGWSSMDDAPVFARQVLAWLGVWRDRGVLITRPTLIERLSVWPQAEQHHGPGPSAAHLDRMDALVAQRLPQRRPRAGALYVSRARMHARLAGEGYLERVMRSAGARVIRPETLPLVEQLEAYAAAEVLLFVEGSAVQSVRLLGRDLGHVIVIQRRPGDRIAEDALEPRAASLSYRDALAGIVCGLTDAGRPFRVLGLPIVDADKLIDQLADAVPGLRDHWDADAYRAERDADVMAWLERSLLSPRVSGERSWEHMLLTLGSSGLSHLVDSARAMMAHRPQPTGSGPAEGPVAPSPDPGPSAPELLDRIAQVVGATSYLELGVGAGATFERIGVAERTAVDLRPLLRESVRAEPGVRVHAQTSDAFLAGLAPGTVYDLVYIDGLHTFEQAYRDLCGVLRHTDAGSVIVLAATRPVDELSAHRDADVALRSQAPTWFAGPPWQGDVFKVVFAIHDLHTGLRYATIAGPPTGRTLIWRASEAHREPAFGSLEAISRLTFGDLQDHLGILQLMSADDALAQLSADIRRDREGPEREGAED